MGYRHSYPQLITSAVRRPLDADALCSEMHLEAIRFSRTKGGARPSSYEYLACGLRARMR